jgi:hypothetical protein
MGPALLDALSKWAEVQPEKPGATWLQDDGTEGRRLTYGQIDKVGKRAEKLWHVLRRSVSSLGPWLAQITKGLAARLRSDEGWVLRYLSDSVAHNLILADFWVKLSGSVSDSLQCGPQGGGAGTAGLPAVAGLSAGIFSMSKGWRGCRARLSSRSVCMTL